MVRVALVAALAMTTIAALPAIAQDKAATSDVDALIEKVEQRYRDIGSFRTRFVQRLDSASFGADDEHAGVIRVSPPGRMLWEYDVPEGQRAALDGSVWWLDDPEAKIIYRRQLDPGRLDPFTELIAGRLDISTIFSARRADSVAARESDVVIELMPKSVMADIERVIIEVDPDTGDLRHVTSEDPLGNRIAIRLSAPESADALTAKAVAYVVPDGYVETVE